MFGKPTQRGISSERGAVLQWIYSEANVTGATFIPIVGAFAGGMETRNKSLVVTMEKDGTVGSFDYTSGGIGSNGGSIGTDTNFENAKQVPALKSPKANEP